jgi:hypothetical protein
MFRLEVIDQLACLPVTLVDNGNDLEQLVKRNGNRRRLDGELDHGSASCRTTATARGNENIAGMTRRAARVP